MPYQIKNGIIYSGNAVTLTQAQYDALTTAEKNNGTVYYIYDSDAVMDAGNVGIEGGGTLQDLVGSVATIEASPATAAHAVGSYILWNGQMYKVIAAIAVGETFTAGTNIVATSIGDEISALNAGLTDKYSTDEKVVGEWIDGKPIYRKTYKVTSGFSSGMTVANLTAMNVETIISISGMLSRSEGITITIPNGNPQAAYNAYAADVNGVLQVGYGSSITPRKILLSIMYTKTTD